MRAAAGTSIWLAAWTINEPSALARWSARADVRWIETDRPDLVPAR